jgi:hypothetical protein|tara:strand:+ start:89 stop:190 length:102 start_codon:yes stop_codon:yes gene_type:complete
MRKFGADYSIGFKNGIDIKIYSEKSSFYGCDEI